MKIESGERILRCVKNYTYHEIFKVQSKNDGHSLLNRTTGNIKCIAILKTETQNMLADIFLKYYNWNEQVILNNSEKHILLRKKYHKFYYLFIIVHLSGNII